jgi:hypothetical protein
MIMMETYPHVKVERSAYQPFKQRLLYINNMMQTRSAPDGDTTPKKMVRAFDKRNFVSHGPVRYSVRSYFSARVNDWSVRSTNRVKVIIKEWGDEVSFVVHDNFFLFHFHGEPGTTVTTIDEDSRGVEPRGPAMHTVTILFIN